MPPESETELPLDSSNDIQTNDCPVDEIVSLPRIQATGNVPADRLGHHQSR